MLAFKLKGIVFRSDAVVAFRKFETNLEYGY